MWNIVTVIQSFYLWGFAPVVLIFYEANETLSFLKKIILAVKRSCCLFTFIIGIYVTCVIFFTHTIVPGEEAIKIGMIPDRNYPWNSTDSRPLAYKDMEIQESVLVTSLFIGYFVFTMAYSIGLVALPWDLIVDYFYRPK